MTASTKNLGEFLFSRTLAAVAIGVPVLLTGAVSFLPEGPQRGQFMVYGLGTVLAALVASLVLRAAYTLGLSKVPGIVTSEPIRSVTA